MKHHLGRPLTKQLLLTDQDTFWASLAQCIYESTTLEKIAQMRSKLLLYLAALVFDESFDSLDQLLRRPENTLLPHAKNPRCYRHPAVQMWLHQYRKQQPDKTKSFDYEDVRNMFPHELTSGILQFIRQNATRLRCTCKYTLGYLFAAIYCYDVYIQDDSREGRIDLLSVFKESQDYDVDISQLEISQPQKQIGKEDFFVYIVYTGTAFELWLPAGRTTMLSKNSTTSHVKDCSYQLVRCEPAKIVPVGLFASVGPLVMYTIVEDSEAGIYRVIPHVTKQQLMATAPLHIFISRGLETEDTITLVGYMDGKSGELNPLAFFLDPAQTRMVIIVKHADRGVAERFIAEELKIKGSLSF
jgi:hypothetical protein